MDRIGELARTAEETFRACRASFEYILDAAENRGVWRHVVEAVIARQGELLAEDAETERGEEE